MLSMLRRLLADRSPFQVTVLGLVLLASVGILDHLPGYEISFSIFYLFPIVLVTWYGKRWLGFPFCGLAALVWLLVDYSSGHPYSHHLIPLWNSGVRLGFFLVTSYLLAELKTLLDHEKILAKIDDLTGVLNARAFKDASRGLLELASRYRLPVTGYSRSPTLSCIASRGSVRIA